MVFDDNFFIQRGVNFLPWVGRGYEDGFASRRLLVLGESHYDEWSGEQYELNHEFTRNCVEEVISRDNEASFWKYLEQALLCECRENGWAPNGGQPLWDRLSFYNFVQSTIHGGPRTRPTWEQFQQSQSPFREVMERLCPERVLVCGKGLWEGMEPITNEDDYLHDDVQAYRLQDGTKVWCLATVHPSSGRYSWENLHPVIMDFLDAPEKAVVRLNAPRKS